MNNELNIKERLMSSDPMVRAEVAAEGKYLDRLIYDTSPIVRGIAIFKHYDQDAIIEATNDSHWFVRRCAISSINDNVYNACELLLNDKDPLVRIAIVLKGKYLDKLVNDKCDIVRSVVAYHRYGLDQLVNDPSWRVRFEVARHGYDLDKLVNDPSWQVRSEVARQGYGLLQLLKDKEFSIRLFVINIIIKVKGTDNLLKFEAAKDPIISLIRNIHYNRITDYNEYINHKDHHIREIIASKGYKLDKFINDPDENVRAAVARQGYGLDKLINDPSWYVRRDVAEQGYGLDKLVNDPSWQVRYAVAEQGYGLDRLIDDKHISVRLIVDAKIFSNIIYKNDK